MCHDQIHAMAMEYILRQNDFDAVLGCQDNTIRVITGSTLGLEIGTSGPVMALCSMHGEETKAQRTVSSLLYGTNLGTISNVFISGRDSAPQWSLPDPSKASITALKAFDITQDGSLEVVVSRDDGRLDVYSTGDPSSAVPVKVFGRNIGETIRSIEVGRINSVDFNEIVLAAYSGKIISFTSEPTQQRAPVCPSLSLSLPHRAQDDTYGRSIQTVNNENRIKNLKKELEGLRGRVDKERAKMRLAQQKSAVDPAKCLPVDISINSQFALNVDEAAYALSIEIQVPPPLFLLSLWRPSPSLPPSLSLPPPPLPRSLLFSSPSTWWCFGLRCSSI
jgi:Bardet-Biedl syndrome 7 protein